jgi:ABC-type dipeptide/oligopeptide/nickel transport system permease subunit
VYAFALNLQGLLSARALARPNAATGVLTFSTASAFRHMAHRLVGGACASLIAGVAVAHLALLGGAFFLASMAIGYRRRAENVDAQL